MLHFLNVFGSCESVKADIASFVSVISFHAVAISLRKPRNMNVVSVLWFTTGRSFHLSMSISMKDTCPWYAFLNRTPIFTNLVLLKEQDIIQEQASVAVKFLTCDLEVCGSNFRQLSVCPDLGIFYDAPQSSLMDSAMRTRNRQPSFINFLFTSSFQLFDSI